MCRTQKIIGPYTNNRGRADRINSFDAGGALANVLTYGDNVIPGSSTQATFQFDPCTP